LEEVGGTRRNWREAHELDCAYGQGIEERFMGQLLTVIYINYLHFLFAKLNSKGQIIKAN